MKTYPPQLKKLVNHLRRLPGVGSKTAERFAFEILSWPQSQQSEIANTLNALRKDIHFCKECGAIAEVDRCLFCRDIRQEAKSICVVAYSREIFSIEATGEFRGMYHVLNGVLSPIDGIGPDQLLIAPLLERLERYDIDEVIIGLDSTLEGDTTALYIKELLNNKGIKLSRLAFGIPMGSSLDYVDHGTLARAFCGRSPY